MNIQEILHGKKKLIEFLKEKGFKEEKDYADEEHADGTYFKIDKRKLLVVYEVFEEEKLKEIKDHFLIDRGLSYCIIVLDSKLIFFRNFGEGRHFIYSERTRDNPSKIDKLNNITSFDSLFQSKDISASFYEAFRLKRNLLVQHIKNDVEPVQKYLIAQKIFDRFFFIYFLCHKGIIKFKDGGKISGENLFTKILLKNGDFLKNLKKLFHLFNSQEKHLLEIGEYQIVIPYLNGGLFRPDILEQDLDVRLKETQWEEIFEFLNSYHWIIEDVKSTEENEEKILTPEILGHVYERSVVEWEQGFEEEAKAAARQTTERKKKGVYYTPESVTEYISKNTIIPLLIERLGKKYSSFDELIESKNKKDMGVALKILSEVKILDPACGSGAFLIKASELIFNLKRRLNYETKEKKDFYDLKLDIITENIYGADILAGAIEISKLRLWLWLISDFEESKNEIKPLPNIEYNLKVGNSLIGWLDEKLIQTSMNTPLTENVNGIFTGLIAYSENGSRSELIKARELLRAYKLSDYIEAYYILYKIYRREHGLRAEDLRSILETIRKSIYATVTPAFLDYVNTKIKQNYDRKKPPVTQEDFSKLQPFHWRIDFGHIILNGGFDIVIGNPPYFNVQTIEDKKYKLAIEALYDAIHTGENDISYYFYSRSYGFLRNGGLHGFISSRYFIEAKFAQKFRTFLREKFKFVKLIDFGSEVKVFRESKGKEVTIHTVIFLLSKENIVKNQFRFLSVKNWIDDNKEVEMVFEHIYKYDNKDFSDDILSSYCLEQFELDVNRWLLCTKADKDLILKLEQQSATFGDTDLNEGLFYVCKSIESGLDRIKRTDGSYEGVYRLSKQEIINKKIEKKITYNLLKTANVRRYFLEPTQEFLLYITEETNTQAIPNAIKHLEKYKSLLKERYDIKKSNKPWYVLSNLRSKDKFEQETDKIIWPMVAPENRFALLKWVPNNKNAYSADVYYAAPKDMSLDLRYVLAILNSKLINYYHSIISKKTNWGFSYSAQYVAQYPVKRITDRAQKQFINIVDEILMLTESKDYLNNATKQEKVKDLQEKIDLLVYKLYELTPKEVKLVESAMV
jgi:hypothetical protein